LDQIIRTELPREEHAMKKVNAFRKQKGEDGEADRGEEGGSLDRSSKLDRKSDLNKSVGEAKNMSRDSKKTGEKVTEKVSNKGWKNQIISFKDKVPVKVEATPEDSLLRTSVSKAINASQHPVKQSTTRQSDAEPSVPNFRIDPKNEKAVEINGDEETEVVIGNRFSSSTSTDRTSDPLASASTKLLSLKALNEYIDDFLAKKKQHDDQGAESQASRTTPENFLLLHLKKKYGLAELIMQNALAIVESAKHFNGRDYKASLFSHVGSSAPPKRNR
jgi:hypothetical protein